MQEVRYLARMRTFQRHLAILFLVLLFVVQAVAQLAPASWGIAGVCGATSACAPVLLWLTGLGGGVASLVALLAEKRLARPLRQLMAAARRSGLLSHDAGSDIWGRDGIDDLSRAFDGMREGIVQREHQLHQLAYSDTLTGLPNRAQFVRRLVGAIARERRSGRQCHVLMLDLDRFKVVNDTLGHGIGDAVLCAVASRLQHAVNANERCALARLGGDEFAVLLQRANPAQSLAVAAQLLKALEAPLNVDEHAIDMGASIGIACFPQHGADAETLLRRSEIAMYAAKSHSGEALVYAAALECGGGQKLCLLGDMRRALDSDQFRLVLQPKLELSTGRLVGVEVLLRWQHPQRGLICPDEFIPFAEQTGFIRRLTHWVMEQSAQLCRQLCLHERDMTMAVNLSTRDLTDPGLLPRFEQILARYQVAAAAFCFEITESAIMDDAPQALLTMQRLHALGASLAIDDFGTGYSSLAYLKRLPVHELKLDKSFVMNMERDGDDAMIVRSTVDLAHNMGLRVVAEGIESKAVWELLVRMGCDQGQGYAISKPMPAAQFLEWSAARSLQCALTE
jgi:diguanylate cyclase (GGDEF)-like protein